MKNLIKDQMLNGASNYGVYELEGTHDFNEINYSNINNTYYFGGYQFRIARVNNDVYGNPLYKLILAKDFENCTYRLKGLAYRCYNTKGYALVQSYNIALDLRNIMLRLVKEDQEA